MSPHLRKTLVVVGHGMVGHRFVAGRDRARPHRDPRHRGRRRGAAAGVRPGRPDLLLRGRRRRSCRSCRTAVRRPAGAAAPRHRGRRRSTRDTASVTAGRRRGRWRTTSWCWRPAPRRSCRPVPGHDLDGCFVYRTIEDLEAIRERRSRRDGRRGDRRRPARPRGRQRAAPARPGDPRRRDGAPADGGAGRRRRRRDAEPAHREPRPRPCTPARRPTGVLGEDGRVTGLALEDARPDRRRGRGLLRRHPAPRRAGPRRPGSTSPSAAASWSTSAAAPPTRTSGRSASARRRAGGCTAWSPPATPWPRSSSTRCSVVPGAFTGADMSTKLKLLGVDVASLRRRARGDTEGALELVFADAVAGRLQEAGRHPRTASGCSAASWSATRRRTACSGRWSPAGIALPDNPEELILPAAAGGAEIGLPDEARSAPATTSARRRSSTVAARRWLRRRRLRHDLHAGRQHLRLLQAGGEEDRRGVLRGPGQGRRPELCEHFPLTRQELFDVVAVHGYTRFDDIVEAPRHRPRLRHLQARRRLDPGQPAQRARARAADRAPCRTPTTPTSPTSSATAPTRSSRASPAARSRPRS